MSIGQEIRFSYSGQADEVNYLLTHFNYFTTFTCGIAYPVTWFHLFN